MRRSGLFFISIAFIPAVFTTGAAAAWFAAGNGVCTEPFSQYDPSAAPDGSGGAVIVWSDQRAGVTDKDIYAQRISSGGELLWGEDDIAVCITSGTQERPVVVADSHGGFVVYWVDARAGMPSYSQVYAQRLDASGARSWDSGGVLVSGMILDDAAPGFALDGAGNSYYSWTEERVGVDHVVCAQKLSLDGARLWGGTGVIVCDSLAYPYDSAVTPTPGGGAIVAWSMYFADENDPSSIFAQRLGGDGGPLWDPDGIELYTEVNKNSDLAMTAGDDGGAWIVWRSFVPISGDTKVDLELDMLYVDTLGITTGDPASDAIAVNDAFLGLPAIEATGPEEVLVVWAEDVEGYQRVFAQKVDRTGGQIWGASGLSVCPEPGDQFDPVVTTDGAGGHIIAWTDLRYGSGIDIYAQRVSPEGDRLWGIAGKPVSTAQNVQDTPAIAACGGGAILAWRDKREIIHTDIYAGKIGPDGGMVPAMLQSWLVRPEGPGAMLLSWTISEWRGDHGFLVERAVVAGLSVPEAGDWKPLEGAVEAAGPGSFIYRDGSALCGASYMYRVYLMEGSDRKLLFESGAVGMPGATVVLSQNRPNPFNPSTVIEYYLPETSAVRIDVYDVAGRFVARIEDRVAGPGSHQASWDGTDSGGGRVSSGIYFYTLTAGKETSRRKMVLLR